MSSIDRPLSGDVLIVSLLADQTTTTPSAGRSARTLLKDGPLRVTVVTIAPGGEIPEHRADGPITVQPLTGQLRFTTGGHTHELVPGQLAALASGLPHAVASTGGATFLLTVCKPIATGKG